ncbi:hypothetical protein V8D89_005129 [Ganoderma adspersum]
MPYNLDSTNTRLVVVGAADTALHYIGNWREVWENGFGDVLQKSTTPSDSVSLQFHGTRILLNVVSTPNTTSAPPTIQFVIDDKPPTTANLQASSLERSLQTLTAQTGLSDDMHRINVTVMQVSSDYPFLLDSFAFAPSSEFWSGALSGSATSHASPSMAPIVGGGIIGGVILALMCMSCIVWLRKRRARRFRYSTISEPEDDHHRPTSRISPFNLRLGRGSRLSCTRPASSTLNINVPHSPPLATEISTARATIRVSQDSSEIQDAQVRQGPKRKGYQLRSSQYLRSLKAVVYLRATNPSISASSDPSSTPLPQEASHVVSDPSGQGSEPPTPPPLYTA